MGYIVFDKPVPYEAGLALQSYLVKRRQTWNHTDEPANVCCILEHPPTFTAGRRIRGRTESNDTQRLQQLGATYHETMRGGQVTFHGPGQLVAYPMIDIRDYDLSVRCYVSALEQVMINTCAAFDVEAQRTEHTGVWIGNDRKIGALGVHLQRYVSSHGLALNCNVSLEWFKEIVACGLHDKETTSLSLETGRTITPQDAHGAFLDAMAKQFGPLQPLAPQSELVRQLRRVVNDATPT